MKENSSSDELGFPPDKPGMIEHYEKRFGIIAVEKGFITADDLVRGLTVQVGEDMRQISHRLLGEIFFDICVMTDQQVEEVLSHISRKVQ